MIDWTTPAKAVGTYIGQALRTELEQQGHVATGRLLDSVEAVPLIFNDGFRIDVYYEDYGNPVDTGVSAGNIPFSPGSGARQSRYITGLIEWVGVKGLAAAGSREAKSIAFAIAHTHKKEGMPSRGSYKFSNNGRRTNWVKYVIDNAEGPIVQILEQQVGAVITRALEIVFDRLQRNFKQAA